MLSSVESVIREFTDTEIGLKPGSQTTPSNGKLGAFWERDPLDTTGLIPLPAGVVIEGCRYRLKENLGLGKAHLDALLETLGGVAAPQKPDIEALGGLNIARVN